MWFDATSESSLKKSLAEINYSLEREDQNAEAFVEWVKNTPGILLVFDNAANPQSIAPYRPNIENLGHVIVTSRHEKWPEWEVISLGLFSIDEGTGLLSKILKKPIEQAFETVVISLEYIPSLISQAGYYLKSTNGSPKSY